MFVRNSPMQTNNVCMGLFLFFKHSSKSSKQPFGTYSIILNHDTSYLKVQAIRWKDPWINVDGLIMPDKKLDLRIQSVDTLFQVVHRVPKQWLFFRWGTKAIRQEVVSSNPHTKIVYSEYIELKKRKKK